MMREWRCTRNVPYRAPGCPGHKLKRERQGYYIQAETKAQAYMQMAKDWPDDIHEMARDDALFWLFNGECFTVDFWRDVE